jgi:outer membrane lipoprotein carrier protein
MRLRLLFRVTTLTSGALVALAVATIAAQSPPTPTAADLAQRIQAHYDTVHDFQAAFTHTYTSGMLGQKDVERGDVKVKKPNRMWWNYTNPTKKVFIADGSRFIDYEPDPKDQQCTISPMPQGEGLSQGLLFLAGRGNLVKDFTPTVPASQPTDGWEITLLPHVPQDDFVTMTLVVDRRTLALKSLATTDTDKTISRMDFAGLKENVGVKDTDFAFTPPRGVKCETPLP